MTITETNKPTVRVFFSYASADRVIAQRLRTDLALGSDVRLFTNDALSAGEDWAPRLKHELSKCDLFLVLLSPRSFESSWVLSEWGAAWALEKPIVAVATRPELLSSVPADLRRAQVLIWDLDDPDTQAAVISNLQRVVSSPNGQGF